MADNPARYANQRLIKASGVDSDAEPVAGAAAFAVAAGRVFALIVASVAGGVALPAVFLPHWTFVVPAAGGPGPAFAGASGVPGLALLERMEKILCIVLPSARSSFAYPILFCRCGLRGWKGAIFGRNLLHVLWYRLASYCPVKGLAIGLWM